MGEPIHLQKPRYLKCRSGDLGHVPFEVIHLPLCIVHALAYPTKKKRSVQRHPCKSYGGVRLFKK